MSHTPVILDGLQDGQPTPKQSADVPVDAQDLTLFVKSVMEQMQNRISQMSEAIIGRVDEMGERIDDLEKSIQDLMVQAEIENPDELKTETPGSNT
ncbi:unnamed protein product [Choristocarpus tenellus]